MVGGGDGWEREQESLSSNSQFFVIINQYYDYNFPTKTTSLKNKRNKSANYVDLSGVSNTSLVSMGANSYYDKGGNSNFSQRSLGVDSRNMQDMKKAPSIEIKPSRERDRDQKHGGSSMSRGGERERERERGGGGVTSQDGKENDIGAPRNGSSSSLPGVNGSVPAAAGNNTSSAKLRK